MIRHSAGRFHVLYPATGYLGGNSPRSGPVTFVSCVVAWSLWMFNHGWA